MSASAMTTRTITAFFDNREDASEAIQRLQTAGIPRTDINMVEGSRSGSSPTQETAGFWESLKEMFLPDEDRYTYAEGLRRGGYLVTVRTNDAHYERALDILDDEGTIDIDERAASWRNEGWTMPVGGSAEASSMSSSTGSADRESCHTDRCSGWRRVSNCVGRLVGSRCGRLVEWRGRRSHSADRRAAQGRQA